MIAAFIAVWLCGFSLNFMSLLGLSLAIGVLIDDAIVVRENIVRHMEMRRRPQDRRAQRHRRDRPGGGGHHVLDRRGVRAGGLHARRVAGEWFRPFGLTVVASVLVSLFISFTLDPMLSAYWGDPPGTPSSRGAASAACWRASTTGSTTRADRYGSLIAWACTTA